MACAAIGVPFAVGCGLAAWLVDINAEGQPSTWAGPSQTAFTLFTGCSLTFTAFPVLAAILSANNLMVAPIGVTVGG
jgi:Kef-type K+ transport system membrane component KefB